MLEIKDLSVSYELAEVVQGVDIEVPKNQIVGLIGPNGAGKSTILKSISNLVPHRQGEIYFNGTDMMSVPAARIPHYGISHVPEGRKVFGELSVEENLYLGAHRHGRADLKNDFEKVYERFPVLKERKKQAAANLSGGEQQMLAIGRALMSRPSFLMLDEPSLGLAPMMVRKVFELIAKIHEEGITIFLVEQNVDLALKYADRIYVLQSGAIVFKGTPYELKEEEEILQAYLGKKSVRTRQGG